MYTVVLMAAMSAGESNPQWLFRHGCGCGCACGGYGYGGGSGDMGMCAGSSWDGAPGYGSFGCLGPGYPTGGGHYANHYNGAHWAGSGGYGAGWPGAYGTCYGYGGGYGGLSTSFTCGGNYGCYGGQACYGIPTGNEGGEIAPGVVVPNAPFVAPAPIPAPMKAAAANKVRSKVIIDAPENAKLYVDGQLMQSNAPRRVFQTPELAVGTAYYYDIKIEVVRDGKIVRDEQRIVVRPGIETAVAFRDQARPDIATVRAIGD